MTSFIDLFDNFSLRLSVLTDSSNKDIEDIKWDLQEIDDECDYFEVPEEKMNLIVYRERSLTFVDEKAADFTKTFTAPQKNKEQYFTLKDMVQTIVDFEKEVRQLEARRDSNGLVDTTNNTLDGIKMTNLDGRSLFSLNWCD